MTERLDFQLFPFIQLSWRVHGIVIFIVPYLLGLCLGEDTYIPFPTTTMDSLYDNTTIEDPLRCYSCQSEVEGSNCVHMNTTEDIVTQVCSPKQRFCKVMYFTGSNTFRFTNRSCAEECKSGCAQAAGSGDFVFLEACYYCCKDNLCNTKNGAASQTCWLGLLLLSICLCFLLSSRPRDVLV